MFVKDSYFKLFQTTGDAFIRRVHLLGRIRYSSTRSACEESYFRGY